MNPQLCPTLKTMQMRQPRECKQTGTIWVDSEARRIWYWIQWFSGSVGFRVYLARYQKILKPRFIFSWRQIVFKTVPNCTEVVNRSIWLAIRGLGTCPQSNCALERARRDSEKNIQPLPSICTDLIFIENIVILREYLDHHNTSRHRNFTSS